jgi:chromosome segregation ATPase
MSESESPEKSGGAMKAVLVVVAGLYILASLYLLFEMKGRIATLEAGQATATAQAGKLGQRIDSNEADLKATAATLAEKLGITEKELAARTNELRRQQSASITKLRKEQSEQIGAVSGQVEGVKSEVGTVKTDVATTRTELEATKEKLERTIGDLGLQSGLIAGTREELAELRRRGERNYFEFTLMKGAKATPVGTISLKLKKVNLKKNRYNLDVVADDRTIEKKDKTILEPVQFYTGRERQLFELVVFSVEKDKVTGYLSTPKTVVAKQ